MGKVLPKGPFLVSLFTCFKESHQETQTRYFPAHQRYEPSVTFMLNSTLAQPFAQVFASVESQLPTEPIKRGIIPNKNVLKFIGSLKFSWDEETDF